MEIVGQVLLLGVFMIDSCIIAGNNKQKDEDLGDVESLGNFIVCRVAILCLSEEAAGRYG